MVTALGRARDGGAAAYLLCEECNNDAGNWYDQAFHKLWNHVAWELLVQRNDVQPGTTCVLSIGPHDPGAAVRSILSGMMGLNPRLRTDFLVLQDAVQYRQVVDPPAELRLLLAVTTDLKLRVAGGGAQRQEMRRGRAIRSVFAHAEIAWAPMYLVLTDASGGTFWNDAQDILPWLRDKPGASRTVNLLLPTLSTDQLHADTLHRGARRATFDGPNGETSIWAS